MKKILLLILISSLYATTEAATINWNSSYKITDSSGSVISSAANFTSLMNGGSLVLVLLKDKTYDGTISVLEGSTIAFKTSPTPQKGKITATYNFAYDDNVLKNGDVLGVMFKDATGNLSQLVYTDGTSINDTLTIDGLTDTTFNANFTYGANGNFTVVPEPTSGLLLLFGLAGLALRRKQA